MTSPDPNLIERLRFQLELFIDGSDRSPTQAQRIAREILEGIPPDDVLDSFLTTATIFGDPDCPFFRTEEEMVKECEDLRRHLTTLC
jgi:hypothetical protein